MEEIDLKLKLVECSYCQYRWYPRISDPKCCPNCGARSNRSAGFAVAFNAPFDHLLFCSRPLMAVYHHKGRDCTSLP